MRKWKKNEDGLFVTACVDCGKEKLTKKRPYEGTGRCLSCAAVISYEKKRDKVINPERNAKISRKRKGYWNQFTKAERKEIMNKNLGHWVGSEDHLSVAKANQVKATKSALNLKGMSAPEVEFAEFLQELEIPYETQFFVEQFPFDFYLPDTQQLIEIDGEFYHPLTEADAVYPMQKHNFDRDKRKNKVAEEHGFRLTRLRIPKS